jgi:tripartite-type tricarboxylate transporter receptor subunit TctC
MAVNIRCPTFTEANFPLDVLTSFGVVAAAGTPPQISARAAQEIARTMKAPATAESWRRRHSAATAFSPISEAGDLVRCA